METLSISRLIKLAALLAVLIVSVSAGALELRLSLPQITVDGSVEIIGRAAAQASVVVTVSGPAVVPGKTIAAGRDGSFSATLGPFTAAGDYTIAAAVGGERATAQLKVAPPAHAMSMALGALGAALEQAVDASDQALAQVKSDLDAVSGDDPDLNKAKEEIDKVREALPEIREKMRTFSSAERRHEQMLISEPALDKEVMKEYEEDVKTDERSLKEQTERLIALGRENSGGRTDACVAVAIASSVLSAQKTLLSFMQNSLQTFIEKWARGRDIDTGVNFIKWIQDRFLRGMRSIFAGTPEEQVAERHGPPQQPGMRDNVSGWSLAKVGFNTVTAFTTGGPWAAAKTAIDGAIGIGIDAYTKTHCLVFKGQISGHTHVEALDNKRPMYELDNDWEGQVEFMSAKPSGKEPVAFRGYITGRAKNFKVKNGLWILYQGKPGNFKYLTGAPSAARQISAVFLCPIEGTVEGDKCAIKARRGGLDFDGRLVAQLAVVILPTGSPVPLVQKYDTPYQPGWWQVTRALGEGGMTTLEIKMDGDKRVIKKDWTRELSSAGAKGSFTIKFDLCAGCPNFPFGF
jgi:hypothetical protein